jgi:hypothetical protein
MKSSVFGAIPRAEFTPVFSPTDCASAVAAKALARARAKIVVFIEASIRFDAEHGDSPKVPVETSTSSLRIHWLAANDRNARLLGSLVLTQHKGDHPRTGIESKEIGSR